MPTVDEVRPFPISSIRDQVEARLARLDPDIPAVILGVDNQKFGGGVPGSITSLALMVNVGKGFSFAGWMAHSSDKAVGDSKGFEIRWVPGSRSP